MIRTTIDFDFHVALVGAPEIWRRICMQAHRSLWDLPEAIYGAYDRVDDHMFCSRSRRCTRSCRRNRTCSSWRSMASHPTSSNSGRQGGCEERCAVLIA